MGQAAGRVSVREQSLSACPVSVRGHAIKVSGGRELGFDFYDPRINLWIVMGVLRFETA
jgi:hypothetical protein